MSQCKFLTKWSYGQDGNADFLVRLTARLAPSPSLLHCMLVFLRPISLFWKCR